MPNYLSNLLYIKLSKRSNRYCSRWWSTIARLTVVIFKCIVIHW